MQSGVGRLQDLLNAGLDPADADPSHLDKIRTINVGLLVMAAIALPFALQYSRLRLWHMTAAVLVTAAVAIATLISLRRNHNAERAGTVAGFTILTLLLLSNVTSGGFYDPNFGWLYVVPLVGAAVASRRSVWVFTILVVLATIAFWALPELGVEIVSRIPPDEHGLQSLLNRMSAEIAIGVLVIALVARHERNERRIERLASFDPLTDLPNRRYLEHKLDVYESRARRGDQIAILLIDLDRFKTINDSLGHDGGDELLKEVAGRLQGALEDRSDVRAFVARFGGDEFVVAVERCPSEAWACDLAASLVRRLESPFHVFGYELFPGGSVGIALSAEEETWGDVLRRADNALYDAKRRGGGGYATSTKELIGAEERKMALESKLRRALDRDELHLAYQPLVDAQTSTSVGCEALLRWECGGEAISPAEFIPLAEQIGEIHRIGRWVLQRACEQQVRWRKELGVDVKMAVNVSALQLRGDEFLAVLRQVIEQTAIDPGRLELELTESALIDAGQATLTLLEQIRDLGVELVLDDFGTGYSSLSYLQRYPFSTLKIDRSFVAAAHENDQDARLVGSISALAHSLSLRVVAEGVEEPAQAQRLRTLHCDVLQGYYFGRPVSAERCAGLLTAGPLPSTATEASARSVDRHRDPGPGREDAGVLVGTDLP